MNKCIYCTREKNDTEFSLEHVIPQFLGGSQAPDTFKTKDVCKSCNNNLGLFVDASFEKDFLVFNNLKAAAYAFFDPEDPSSLPLHYMGVSKLIIPHIKNNEICEYWLGPLGELILWVRPDDEKMYWYSGGNPRLVKEQESRAYFMFSERSNKNREVSLLSFKDAFSGKPVKKIICTTVSGEDPKAIGFSNPDQIDIERISHFHKKAYGKSLSSQLRLNPNYDRRFLAKLAIGVSHCIFGNEFRSTPYMAELYKALWYREGDHIPSVLGNNSISCKDENILRHTGIQHGIVVAVIIIGDAVVISLNIGQKLHWCIQCAKVSELSQKDRNKIGQDGLCIVLYKSLNEAFVISFKELLSHNNGDIKNTNITRNESLINKHSGYFENL